MLLSGVNYRKNANVFALYQDMKSRIPRISSFPGLFLGNSAFFDSNTVREICMACLLRPGMNEIE